MASPEIMSTTIPIVASRTALVFSGLNAHLCTNGLARAYSGSGGMGRSVNSVRSVGRLHRNVRALGTTKALRE